MSASLEGCVEDADALSISMHVSHVCRCPGLPDGGEELRRAVMAECDLAVERQNIEALHSLTNSSQTDRKLPELPHVLRAGL